MIRSRNNAISNTDKWMAQSMRLQSENGRSHAAFSNGGTYYELPNYVNKIVIQDGTGAKNPLKFLVRSNG